MQRTAMVAARQALTVTEKGCEQVRTSSFPESVTLMMSGERPITWYDNRLPLIG